MPARILDTNAFGNLLVEDVGGRVWRICPEELACDLVGSSALDLEDLRSSADRKMDHLIALATESLGPLAAGRCFCLRIPGVLGGRYDSDNLASIALTELIAASGDMAAQIQDSPDAAKVEIRIID